MHPEATISAVVFFFCYHNLMTDSLGLEPGSVELVPYNSEWSKLFQQEKKRLLEAFDSNILDIEHCGSTAIADIPAKPAIDIYALVESLESIKEQEGSLQELGYVYADKQISGQRELYAKRDNGKNTHYLHFILAGEKAWENQLLFRDYLRDNPEVARAYSELKQRLSKEFPHDKHAYTHGKDEFVQRILKQARRKED